MTIACDCGNCENRKHIPGRTWGDPDSCYPPEDVCKKDAPEGGPCERMLDAVHGMILDGRLDMADGYFIDRDWALQIQQGDASADIDPWFTTFDFSGSLYWFLPYNSGAPLACKDIEAVYRKVFG
jgi:hypothetical protein